jgi:ATP-dependent helicase/nuclease subunit A
VEIFTRGSFDLLSGEVSSKISREIKQAELFRYSHALPEDGAEEVLYEEILRQSGQKYLYEEAVQLKTKFTVSELKRADFSEDEEFDVSFDLEEINKLEEDISLENKNYQEKNITSWCKKEAVLFVPDTDMLMEQARERQQEQKREKLVPAFLKTGEKELSGTALGTIYHRVMQHLDFSHADTPMKVSRQLGKLEKDGILSKEERSFVRPAKIAAFVSSAMGERIAKAQKEGRLFREQPFVMGVDAQIFMKKKKMPETTKEKELVLVQGIIDIFFEEDGKLVLLDYKTDRVQTAEELKGRYDRQLDYYAEALERARNLEVGEKYLYSFRLEELISV